MRYASTISRSICHRRLCLDGVEQPAFAGGLCSVIVEGVLGVVFAGLGWTLRRRGMAAKQELAATWRRCLLPGVPAVLLAYVLSYMLLMDRSRPTMPSGEYYRYFDSSLRMVPNEDGRFGGQTPY